MKSLDELNLEKDTLEKALTRISIEINQRLNLTHSLNQPTKNSFGTLSKSGYLQKWQDRQIGWQGTKWDLRFVRLEGGKMSYFLNHCDSSPRYVLTMKNCAIRDDGYKVNKRFNHRSEVNVHVKTPGAYHHVFTIYQRQAEEVRSAKIRRDGIEIVPLLRFSTTNFAEKKLWMEALADSCAFCDSPDYAQYEKLSKSQDENFELNSQIPFTHNKGTLPFLYFVPPQIRRNPSYIKVKRSAHMKMNMDEEPAKSNSTKVSGFPPSKPMHRTSEASYLSHDAPMQNYRGLLNLGIIILVISNFRILLNTTREYGFVLSQLYDSNAGNIRFSWAKISNSPLLYGMSLLCVFVVSAYKIEKATGSGVVAERIGMFLHFVNTNAALCVPTLIVWYRIESPFIGSLLLLCACILWMKLVSYVHVNYDYRRSMHTNYHDSTDFINHLDEGSKLLRYPRNLTLSNISYFWFAPTLTYQIAYPRLARRNIIRIFLLIIRLFLSNIMIVFLIAQFIRPTLSSLIKQLESGRNVSIYIFGEYMLKLGIASTYIWLLVFYGFFHVYLNLLAEILKFGDRVFYRDWWNSSNLSSYWRLWNLPVHYWLVRHVYFPSIRAGLSKNGSMFLVFFFSAVIHELLISIPFHMIKTYSFIGMISQIPLIFLTKYIDRINPGSSLGNMIFWLSFCIVGQPMAVIMYTIDHWKANNGLEINNVVDNELECSKILWFRWGCHSEEL